MLTLSAGYLHVGLVAAMGQSAAFLEKLLIPQLSLNMPSTLPFPQYHIEQAQKVSETRSQVCAEVTANSLLYTMPRTTSSESGLQTRTPTPSMAATSPVLANQKRTQPWKKHWPPKQGTETEKAYGFKEGAPIVIYGN